MNGRSLSRNDRLENEKNIWLATIRPDGRPHLVPIWFVWVRERVFICTEGKSIKARNISANPRVSFSLESGNSPVIGEGHAMLLPLPYPPDVIATFKAKFDWDITTDATYSTLIEITPHKWLMW
jgi:PPOX class probable F420-dependent enzyme